MKTLSIEELERIAAARAEVRAKVQAQWDYAIDLWDDRVPSIEELHPTAAFYSLPDRASLPIVGKFRRLAFDLEYERVWLDAYYRHYGTLRSRDTPQYRPVRERSHATPGGAA